MKKITLTSSLALCAAVMLSSSRVEAAKPAEALLPDDTLALITVRDIARTNKAYQEAPFHKLLKDPALQPFLSKFNESCEKYFLKPLEEKFSLDLTKVGEMAEGQLTFALTPGAEFGKNIPGFLVMTDVGSKTADAEKFVTNIKSQLSRNEVQFVERRIQGSSLVEIGIPQDVIPDELQGKGLENIWVGLSKSLLLIATDQSALEKVIISNQGGNPPSLSQNSGFQSALRTMNGKMDSLGWFNMEPVLGFARKMIESTPAPEQGPSPMAVLKATGLEGLKSMSFHTIRDPDGEFSQLTLHVPSSERSGIFEILSGSSKPSGPLPFLPEEVASFSRSRLDLKKAFSGVEKMISGISPEMGGLMTFMMAGIGKDQDKSFDFRRDFIGNLGDDLATIVMPAEGAELEAIAQQPQMFLIGSGGADKLLYSAKILSSMVPNLEVETTDFLGRKVLSANVASGEGIEMGLFMTSHDGYLMITQNRPMLEQILRGNVTGARKLTGSSAFRRAVDKVGGTGTGLFGFDDPEKSLGPLLGAIKNEPDLFQEIVDNITSSLSLAEEEAESWIDLSLLPNADVIAKYLEVSVYAGLLDNDGFKMKIYTPDPEGL